MIYQVLWIGEYRGFGIETKNCAKRFHWHYSGQPALQRDHYCTAEREIGVRLVVQPPAGPRSAPRGPPEVVFLTIYASKYSKCASKTKSTQK